MANYLDQIPKQLAARRKAFAAARDNPALLPSCWAIVRSIANNMYDYMRNAVIGGCTFPDRPVFLSVEDAAFLDFGCTPRLLAQDAAWLEAEAAGAPPPDADPPRVAPERESDIRRRLAGLAGLYGQDQSDTRVYNLEPWLQDMYRDRLDVDFAEDLQRQIDALNQYMDGVPKALRATGLAGKLQKGVMSAFNLFKTITGSSHQLDREKMSFVDRRSYVDTMQKIELIMTKADESLGAAAAGRSVVRELFNLWKDANYEMMALTRQLRVLWAGTSLDDRIAELANLLGAVQKALNRATEESASPSPQLPILRADEEARGFLARREIVEAFESVILYDMVIGANTILATREIRKFGPLAVVIAPGAGQPRYCREIRRLSAAEDEDDRRPGPAKTQIREREMDVDRRVRYPLNCLVVPVGTGRENLLREMADAWLEFNQAAFPMPFKEFLEAAKGAAPAAFLPPAGKESKDLPASHARQMLARLVAAFARWAHDGTEPAEEEAPGFEAFRAMVLSRLDGRAFLIPLRHRPFLDLFSEAGARRRMEMWKRCLGPRFPLDRQLVAVNVLRKDWRALRESLAYLPLVQTRGNSGLENGFAKAADQADPFAEHKALSFFRKFLSEQPDLKAAMVAVESQVSIEVETLRSQSESLGRVFQYDQASAAMLQRQASQIQEKRLAANRHIDHYLTGLMYALDGNYEAAEGALAMCLAPAEGGAPAAAAIPEEVGADWFEASLKPREGKFEKRKVPGEDGPGTVCRDFIYYNLGVAYRKMGRHIEAMMSFHGVAADAPERSHLYRMWAGEMAAEAREKLAEAEAKERIHNS